MQTNDYLNSLQNDKQNLVTKLSEKGVTVTGGETFTELIPKLDEIQSGGGDISEYFDENITYRRATSQLYGCWIDCVKNIPALYFSGNSAESFFALFDGEEIDLSNFDISETTSLSNMFSDCNNLKTINLSNFFTEKVTNMSTMFSHCNSLNKIDLSHFDMGKVNRISNIFLGCGNLVDLKFGYDLGKNYAKNGNNYGYYTLSLNYSNNLTHDSLMLVIDNLYDLALTYDVENGGTLLTQKLVLGTTNLAKLTAEEISFATIKGWTIS